MADKAEVASTGKRKQSAVQKQPDDSSIKRVLESYDGGFSAWAELDPKKALRALKKMMKDSCPSKPKQSAFEYDNDEIVVISSDSDSGDVAGGAGGSAAGGYGKKRKGGLDASSDSEKCAKARIGEDAAGGGAADGAAAKTAKCTALVPAIIDYQSQESRDKQVAAFSARMVRPTCFLSLFVAHVPFGRNGLPGPYLKLMLVGTPLYHFMQTIEPGRIGKYTEAMSSVIAFMGTQLHEYLEVLNSWTDGNSRANGDAATQAREHVIRFLANEVDIPVDHGDLVAMVLSMMVPYFDNTDTTAFRVNSPTPLRHNWFLTTSSSHPCSPMYPAHMQPMLTAKSLADGPADITSASLLEACATAVQASNIATASSKNLHTAHDIVDMIVWARLYHVWLPLQKEGHSGMQSFAQYCEKTLKIQIAMATLKQKISVRIPPLASFWFHCITVPSHPYP